MRQIITFILNTLFPPRCVSCKKEGDFLCKNCIANFAKKKIATLPYIKPEPAEFEYLDGVIYALDYEKNPQIQAAIKQFKYKFTMELTEYFSALIKEKLSELQMTKNQPITLIPVPLHPKRLSYRGFNQAEVIASSLNAPITHALTRIKNTSQQAKLNKKERHENLDEAFKVNSTHFDDSIHFLVDDVCSTGATLENCAKVLKNAGLKKVYGLVVARAIL